MADVKKLQTRIALKYDSYTNWTDETKEGLGANLVLLKGEIGICEIPSGNNNATTAPTVLFKVGDGEKPFKSLKWASALAADVYAWAKASTVEMNGKKLTFVGGKADGGNFEVAINYATPEEVAAAVKVVSDNLAGVDARVVALEGKFGTGDGTVDKKIEALEGRMTTAEGDIDTLESTKLDASVFNAFNDGTSKKVSEIEADIVAKANAAKAGAEATAASALAGAVSTLEAADSALGGRIDALVGDNGTIAAGDAATLASAKSYADTKKSEVIGDASSTKDSDTVKGAKLFATDAANTAKAGAEQTASEALAAAVKTLNEKDAALVAEDSRLAGLIGDNKTAIEKEVTDRGTAISTAVTNVTNAYTTAIGTAKTELEGKITAEETARVNAINALTQTVNTNAGTVTAEITRVEGLVTTEASKRAEEDGKLDGRLQKVEAFFEGAYTEDGQPVKEALDTLVEIQNFITGDGEAASSLLDAIDANATAIENLEDRVDTAEDDIDALEGRATAVEGRATTLENIVDGYGAEGDDYATVKAHVAAVSVRAEKGISDAATAQAAAEAAQSAADKAQGEVDTLEGVVAGVKSTADGAAQGVTALEGRMDTAEGQISALETASAKHAEKTYVDTELAKYVKTADYTTDKTATTNALNDRYTKSEADGKFATITTVSNNTTEIGKNAAAIAKNAGDISTNATAIGTEKTRAEGEEAKIRGEFAAADTQISTRIDTVVNTTIPAAEAAAKKHADDQVDALKKGDVATNTSEIAKVSGRVQTLEDRFGGWFVIDCGSSTTVIDETK